MGHKVNPYGFRLGVIYPWKSKWYAGKEYAKALHLVADCAKFCDLSADLIASQSPLMVHSCLACAEACKACATECDKLDSAEMKSCVKACHECETTCRAMVKAMGHGHHG